eukprot:GEMP01014774.1.p1 GENE.GEMP01014774.1~~GEMP01014774.1.p1  ORF type:complete len:601 (+),score=132.69 GEMP01014774.1:33-1805(+)
MGQCGSIALTTVYLTLLTRVTSASSCVLNDDYCDCGWDEPATSACAGHHSLSDTTKKNYFLCSNPGAEAPAYIAISRVNDGTCDCCDGADESSNRCGNRCEDWRHALERNWLRWNGSEIANEVALPTIAEMQKQLDAQATEAAKDGRGLFEWKKKEKQKLRKLKKNYRALWEKYVMNGEHSTPATADVLQLACYPTMTILFIRLVPRTFSQIICDALCRGELSEPPKEVGPGGIPIEPMCIFEIPNSEPLYLRVEPVDDVERALLEGSPFFDVQRKGGDEEEAFFALRDELAMTSMKAREAQKSSSMAAQKANVFRQMSNSHHFADGKHSLFDLCLELEQLEFNWSTANMEQWRKVYYRICFFASASQKDLEDENASTVLIGRATDALTFSDGQQCGDIRRSLKVKLSCGSSKLHEVRNVDKCTYEADVSHPFACRPLGPFQGWKGPPLMPGENIDEFSKWMLSEEERVEESTGEGAQTHTGGSGEWVMWEFLLLHSTTVGAFARVAMNSIPLEMRQIVAPVVAAGGQQITIRAAFAEQVLLDSGIWTVYIAFLRDFESQYPQHAQKMPQEPLDMMAASMLILVYCCFGR